MISRRFREATDKELVGSPSAAFLNLREPEILHAEARRSRRFGSGFAGLGIRIEAPSEQGAACVSPPMKSNFFGITCRGFHARHRVPERKWARRSLAPPTLE